MTVTLALRVVELETQLTFQQATLEALNGVVTQQQAQLEQLEKRLAQVSASLRLGGGTPSDGADEPPPPHY